MEYTLLDSDRLIENAVPGLNALERIAVDFECEFNLHIYGEHLCLIQIFTGSEYLVIDPRAKAVTAKGLKAFFLTDTEKIWFDSHSDHSLVYKNYGIQIRNIYDIRVPAKLLGYDGNLLSLERELLGLQLEFAKKKNQTANWLCRPISDDQMEYALADVAHLIELKAVLDEMIAKHGLEDVNAKQMKAAITPKPATPGWKNLPGWRNLGKKERIYAKWFFIARDKIAERFNVPPHRVFDKHSIVSLASHSPTPERISSAMTAVNPRFRKFLADSMMVALKRADEESGKRD